MAFKAVFYQFEKRENSTAQPLPSVAKVEYDIVLKGPCSVIAPQIELQIALDTAPTQYNYCYIAAFARYYWVRDWTFNNRLWTASLSCDVLGTYKYKIGISSQYVVRSASMFDGSIVDNLYPVKSNYETYVAGLDGVSPNFYQGWGNGCYILSVQNGDNVAVGGVSYYAMTDNQMQNLRRYMMGNSNVNLSDFMQLVTEDITDVTPELVKALFNPFQYISGIMWVPIPIADITDANDYVSGIQFGHWVASSAITAWRIQPSNLMHTFTTVTITAGQHPQSNSRGNYLNSAPYTDTTLFYPPFGSIPIDSVLVAKLKDHHIYLKERVDLITGIATLAIYGEYDLGNNTTQHVELCPIQRAQLGIPIQISGINTNYLANNTMATVSIGADIISGLMQQNGSGVKEVESSHASFGQQAVNALGNLAGGTLQKINSWYLQPLGLSNEATTEVIANFDVTSAISGIGNVSRALMTSVQTNGSNGSIADIAQYPYFQQIFYYVCDDDITHRGKPLCQVVRINTLSGFIQVADPDIALNSTTEEQAAIKSYMVKGFYFE